MKANRFLILLYLFLLVGVKSVAQDTELIPLNRILNILEKRFDVVFTFADENIQGKYAAIPNADLSLDECLSELENQTNLHFLIVNDRYIAIQNNRRDSIVSGTIIDNETQEYLVGAVIISGKNYALSDEAGRFSIAINQAEDSLLLIQHIGYRTLRLKHIVWENMASVYELVPDNQMLEEVVINYIASGFDKLKDGSVQLHVKNLEVLPGLSEPDVLHGIQVLPGIQSMNETVSDLNTRGGTNDQNLVLWDGVKMYQTGHFFGLISAFNSHLVHQTRVVKNGTSAAYAEGISGIIDMRQQDYLVNDFEVSTGLNMISTDAILKIPVHPKVSLIVGARSSINSLVETPTYKNYYKRAFEHTEVLKQHGNDTIVDNNQDFSFYDLSCKFLYDISESDKIRIGFLHVYDQIESEESTLIRDTLYQKRSHLEQSSLTSNLHYKRSWSEKHSTQFSLAVSNYYLEGTDIEFINKQQHLQKNEVLDWGIKLESKNKLNRVIELSTGYQFDEIGIRNQDNIQKLDYNRDVKDVLRIHSLYSEAEFKKLFEKLYLRFGLRSSYFPKFGEFLMEPRAVLSFSLNRFLSLELLTEKKSQHTTQLIDFQTDFLGVEKRRWVLSNNKSVPFLKSHQYSLGIQFNRNNFLCSVEGYMKKVTGIITPSQGFQNQFQYVYAIGEYNAKGIEVLVNKRFSQSNIWANYTLAKNDYYFEELIPSAFPNNFDVRHTLFIGGSYTLNQMEVSAGMNYRTGQPYTRPAQNNNISGNEIVYEAPNNSRLKDYLRLDISAKYYFKVRKGKGEFGLSVWNLLNRENTINVFYQRNDANEIEQITQNALGITPNVNLRLMF